MNQQANFNDSSSGLPIRFFHIKSDYGMLTLSNYGASIHGIVVPDRSGVMTDVVLGYDREEQLICDRLYMGSTIGRCANRLSHGILSVNGMIHQLPLNEGSHHLHGGPTGFHQRIWDAREFENGIVFTVESPDGDGGYPGKLWVTVIYHFNQNGVLTIDHEAVADADTVVNLANHAYFHLGGHEFGAIGQHQLQLNSREFTPNGPDGLPDGRILSVTNTPLDFQVSANIQDHLDLDHAQLIPTKGIDHNVVLAKGRTEIGHAARLCHPHTGIMMDVWTDMPGLQVYTGNHMPAATKGKRGSVYKHRSGICLETQFWPDSSRHSHFPSPVLKAGSRYKHRTEFHFSTDGSH
jgi:aldose 1-epimerase